MSAERRPRTSFYLGPKQTITREELGRLEGQGYFFEEKFDGDWCLAESTDVICDLTSRTGLSFGDADRKGLIGTKFRGGAGFLNYLVGELTADKDAAGKRCGTRRLHVFDLLMWNGFDVRPLPQAKRREMLVEVYKTQIEGVSPVISLVEARREGAIAFFDEIVGRGGEGVVAKHPMQRYRCANADGKVDGWLRAKPHHTMDLVVMGYGFAEKGTPNLRLGLWRHGRLVEIQTCTLPPSWTLPLDAYPGRVVEVRGWEVFPSGAIRSGQLGHRPGPRDDKRPEECTWEAEMM